MKIHNSKWIWPVGQTIFISMFLNEPPFPFNRDRNSKNKMTRIINTLHSIKDILICNFKRLDLHCDCGTTLKPDAISSFIFRYIITNLQSWALCRRGWLCQKRKEGANLKFVFEELYVWKANAMILFVMEIEYWPEFILKKSSLSQKAWIFDIKIVNLCSVFVNFVVKWMIRGEYWFL